MMATSTIRAMSELIETTQRNVPEGCHIPVKFIVHKVKLVPQLIHHLANDLSSGSASTPRAGAADLLEAAAPR
jgi:hypothetical protein